MPRPTTPPPADGARQAIERILRKLGLLPPQPELVIARVPRRPAWPPPRR